MIYAVRDDGGLVMTIGPTQLKWLIEQELVTEVPAGEGVEMWHANEGRTIMVINEMVFGQLELRQCDFCAILGAPWEIPCRPFQVHHGPTPGGTLGGPGRPMAACSICVKLIRENRKRELIERMLVQTIKDARRKGGLLAQIVKTTPEGILRRQILPMVKEVVEGTFAHRDGFPRRAEAT